VKKISKRAAGILFWYFLLVSTQGAPATIGDYHILAATIVGPFADTQKCDEIAATVRALKGLTTECWSDAPRSIETPTVHR
jgi:hypothetical protein